MKKAYLVVSIALIAITACGIKKGGSTFTAADLERGQKVFPDLTMAQLTEGKTNYETNCKKCHGLKDPKKFTEEQLRAVVPNMSKQAKIDEAKELSILKYMITASGAK